MGQSLTSGQMLPGFYSFVDFNAAGAGTAPNLRALLWGTGKATGIQPFNVPYRPASQQDADDASGRGSELASWFASAVSQGESQGAEVWIMPIAEPSAGVASTYKLKVVLSGANPTKAGTLSLWIKSQLVAQVGFDTTDTASTIATALQLAIEANRLDLPLGAATVVTDTVTIPYAHKGTTGEDLPMQCDISPTGCGVALSPGQATFATNAAGAGTARVSTGSLSVSAAIGNADTPTLIAASVASAWNSDNYPLTAQAAAGVVTFLFRNGRVARRMSAAVITSTGTTVDMGSGVTSGTGLSTSLTYNGTQGTGAPTLTSALANLDKHSMFRSWAAPWVDTATMGSLATKMEAQADGSITGQKPQCLTICSPLGSSVAGAIPTGTSPNLTTSAPRYAVMRCEDAPVQGMDLAARVAAVRAAFWIDDPSFNWNGFQLKGNSRAPILLPFDKPSELTQNADLRTYALAPIVKGTSGNLEIVKGRTTSLANDKRYWAWSVEAQAAYHAVDLPSFLRARFQGGSTVRNSEPKAPGLLDKNSVKAAVQEAMRKWEKEGNYDGADAFADFVDVQPDPNNPFRFNIKVPESPVLDLDQLVADFRYTSPST
jgi:phage tail sheath gpL-like